MHNLIQKYRDNELSADDVKKLSIMLDGMSDEELSEILEKDWEKYDKNGAGSLPKSVEERLRKKIHIAAGIRRRKWSMALRAAACCAAALLLIAVGYFAHSGIIMSDIAEGIHIAANDTGGTDVTFPDGSTIVMKPQSDISYKVPPTSDGERSICFTGTGHFRIAKNAEKPFTISSEMLDVTVLGTEFYLSAEPKKKSARLYLQEGLVKFQSKLSGESVELHPGNLASLDYASGRISVSNDSTLVEVFGKSDSLYLNYENTSLGTVVESLNTCYAPFHITLDTKGLGDMEFTGTLPVNNLMESLSILEYTANLKISISNSEVTLYD